MDNGARQSSACPVEARGEGRLGASRVWHIAFATTGHLLLISEAKPHYY
jgi:hypothetical protein